MGPDEAQKTILKCYDFYLDRIIYLKNFRKNFYRSKFSLLSHSESLFEQNIETDEWGHQFNMMIYYLDSDGDVLVPIHTYYNLVNDYNIKNLSNEELAISLILYRKKNDKIFQYYKSNIFFNLLDSRENKLCQTIWNNLLT